MKSAFITEVATYFPDQIVSNAEREQLMIFEGNPLGPGTLEKIFGCHERRIAPRIEQVSDLAVKASLNLDQGISDVDLLIFAAASSDLVEPATSNIIQHKLGLTCAVMDIKNACNSVTTAINVASCFVTQGVYKKVLIVNGEKLSEVINYNPTDTLQLTKVISGCTLGDGGCAIIVSSEEIGFKIVHQSMMNWGQYWELCTVAGGGSMHYKDASKLYFEVDARALKSALQVHGYDFTRQELATCDWTISDIKTFITHQVSAHTATMVGNELGFENHQVHLIFERYGNLAAATVPATLGDYMQTTNLIKGDKVLMVGLAAGISVTVHCLEYYG